MNSTITKDTKITYPRALGACVVIATRGGDSEEQFDKGWIVPCINLEEKHR